VAQILGFSAGPLEEKNDVMMSWLEADSHLKLLLVSILDICKVFEHIDMLFIGI
jgi:hypothetical protein